MAIIDGGTSRPLTFREEFAYNARQAVDRVKGWFPREKRRRALCRAIHNGNSEAIKAIFRLHPEMVRKKISIVNSIPAWTPLETAIENLSWFFDDNQKNCKAAARAIVEMFPQVLAETDAEGRTMLHRLCGEGRATTSQIETLCSLGAGVAAEDKTGATPLHALAANENSFFDSRKILSILVQHGAQIEARDGQGRTPLMRAMTEKACSHVEELLDAGAAIELADNAGLTATMLAVRAGLQYHAKVLLQHGGRLDFDDPATEGFCAPLEMMPEWQLLIVPQRTEYERHRKEAQTDAAVYAAENGLDHDVVVKPLVLVKKPTMA